MATKLPNPDTLDWGSMDKRTFKRMELAYELADEETVASKKIYPTLKEFSLQEVLAVAFAAYRINGSKYIKETRRFSEENNKTTFSNKDIVKMYFSPAWRPDDYVAPEITDDDYEAVSEAMSHFKSYAFKVLGNQLSGFQEEVYSVVQGPVVSKSKLGLVAYVPELIKKDIEESKFKKLLRTKYHNSEHIGKEKDVLDGVIKILHRTYSSKWESNNYIAEYMGNVVSFMKADVYSVDQCYHVKAKIKGHTRNRFFDVNETRLNYVKVKNV